MAVFLKDIEDFQIKFDEKTNQDKDKSQAIIAVELLFQILKNYQAETMAELQMMLREIINALANHNLNISVVPACEQFVRYITLASLEQPNFDECKQILITRANDFISHCYNAKDKVQKLGQRFIQNGSKILTHSISRVVISLLLGAKNEKKSFEVYVTQSQPNQSGKYMHDALKSLGIAVTLVLDSSVGYIMERMNIVLLGCEGVLASGGIINKIGSYQIGLIAKQHNVPVFVAAESFKFSRLFPLRQSDVPNKNKYLPSDKDRITSHPAVDYTPPGLITYLITNVGILTPSAVSEELINLYT